MTRTLKIAAITFAALIHSQTAFAQSVTVNVSVVANDPNNAPLSYQWRSTDGKIVNENSATTTWNLPDGPGLPFAYVLVSNGKGGYTERRLNVSSRFRSTTGSELSKSMVTRRLARRNMEPHS